MEADSNPRPRSSSYKGKDWRVQRSFYSCHSEAPPFNAPTVQENKFRERGPWSVALEKFLNYPVCVKCFYSMR
jgi:hypothetical protein